MRSGPGTNYKVLGSVTLGYRLTPVGESFDESSNGKTWYKFNYNGSYAYVRSDFCKEMTSYSYDATFEADINMKGFPESYKPALRELHANYPNWIFTLHKVGLDFDYVLNNELVGTRTLVNAQSISSYKSTDEGKYDYTTSKWPTFDGSAWVAASREVTAAYLDPRNFLYYPYVFQFEHQTFNQNIHTLAGILEMTKGTFLDDKVQTSGIVNANTLIPNNLPIISPDQLIPVNPSEGANIIYPGTQLTPFDPNVPVVPILQNTNEINVYAFNSVEALGPGIGIINNPGSSTARVINASGDNLVDEVGSFPFTYLPAGTYTYAELIYDACRQVNLNPYVIVSMILQEQGKKGTDSVSGKNSKYKDVYNYGNVNAFASGGLTAIENGLKYASTEGSYNRPWNTKEKGIYGLCDFYATSYVKGGQDTFYLKKWNVQGENLFKHQYMTNVAGAASEGQLLGNAYDDVMLQMPHEFKIPVYFNMSESNYPIPTKDGSPNNKLKNLYVNNYNLTPTFNTNVRDYSIIVDSNVDSVFINAEAYDNKAAVGGIGNIPVTTTYTDAIIYVVAENKDINQYNIHIYKKGVENVQAQQIDYNQIFSILPAQNTNNVYSSQTNNIEAYGPGGQINNNQGINVQIGVGPGQ